MIEVAIVLVIIGLLLGGVLKGQELITSARVRNLISQQDDIKAGYYGFQDRFRALPGDYTLATSNIAGIATASCTGNGDGNGRIETTGSNTPSEHILIWEHLSKSGFISGSYVCNPVESNVTTPANPFAVRLQLVWDAVFDPAGTPRHNLKTGSQIPSDLLAEVDRKMDDGSATGGTFRFSAYDGGAGPPVGPGTCYSATAPNPWSTTTIAANCGAVSLF
jgi:type II secretory pathway pseudopilin PulG